MDPSSTRSRTHRATHLRRRRPHVDSADDVAASQYRVDERRRVVIHDVLGDYADEFIGKSEERPYLLEGDALTLMPTWIQNGKAWKGIRLFVRAQ
jgi:hypothetical protein